MSSSGAPVFCKRCQTNSSKTGRCGGNDGARKRPDSLHRCIVTSDSRFDDSTIQRFNVAKPFAIFSMNLSPEKKIAGVLVPLFALRGENDLGIGDLSTLREFIDWIAEIGFTLAQLLPINETGADDSPYNAISSMAIEPTTLHLAPGSPEDLTNEDFQDALTDVDLPTLRRGRVNYRRVKQLKHRILEKAFANFSAHANEQRRFEFEKFCEEQSSWLHDYALFRVLMEENNGSAAWHRWLSQHQSSDSAGDWIRDLPPEKQANFT